MDEGAIGIIVLVFISILVSLVFHIFYKNFTNINIIINTCKSFYNYFYTNCNYFYVIRVISTFSLNLYPQVYMDSIVQTI